MNTLFKFYYQTWVLYSLAAGVAIAVLWATGSTRRMAWQRAVLAVATILILVAGASYPAIASYQWTDRFQVWRGLDGLAYGEEHNPDDTAAIRWLGEHAAPGDVVLEAAGCSYLPFNRLPFNRVSAFTGVPTVIGWANNHQRQWRAGQTELIDEIDQRQADVPAMFADADNPLFDQYGVTWLFIGEYETGEWRSDCATAGPYDIAQFAENGTSQWALAFRSGNTQIYERIGE
jgi:uncharacterized membrane protein